MSTFIMPGVLHEGKISQAVNPRSVPERSEQTGPNLGPALAKKKTENQHQASLSLLIHEISVLIELAF